MQWNDLDIIHMLPKVAGFLDTQVFQNPLVLDGPKNIGFVLLVFPYNTKEGRAHYVSNGANREDMIKFMEETIEHFKANPDHGHD